MTAHLSLQEKRDLILENEKQFCHQVSAAILDKPRLGVWMILIPVFCVFYFWQLKRYSEGRNEFAENFLIARERALGAAYKAALGGREIEVEEMVDAGDIPEQTRKQYGNWLSLLADNYLSLLRGRGGNYEELVQSVYSSKKQYIHFIQELNRVEREFNAKLQPHLDLDDSEVSDIVGRIEITSAKLRHQQIKEIFS